MRYIFSESKKTKYAGDDAVFFANFMRNITKDLPEDMTQMERMIKKIRKIDHNLHYFTSSQESGEKFIKKTEAETIYKNSRV